MKRLIVGMAKEMTKGVFWVIGDKLLSFPFLDDFNSNGVSKSGNTYNHKRLWPDVKPKGCNEPYNYYPRGRVEITNKGKPVIYLNPNIDNSIINEIKIEFGLRIEPKIQYDYSEHYKCYLDDGWKPDKS